MEVIFCAYAQTVGERQSQYDVFLQQIASGACSENATRCLCSTMLMCIGAWGEQYGSGTVVAHGNNW